MKPIFSLLIVAVLSTSALAQQPRWVRTGHVGGVFSLLFTPDGKHFISAATRDSKIIVWDATTGNYERSIAEPYANPNYSNNGYTPALSLSQDGATIAISGDTMIYLVDFSTGSVTDSILSYTRGVSLVQFSESGDTMVWIEPRPYESYLLCRYDRSARKVIDTIPFGFLDGLPPNSFQGNQFAVSSDASTLAYVNGDTTAIVDLSAPDRAKPFYTPYAQNIALNWDGSQLVASGQIIETKTGTVLFVLPDTASTRSFKFLDHSDTLVYFISTAYAMPGFWLHIPGSQADQFFQISHPVFAGSWAGFVGFAWALSPDRSISLFASSPLFLSGAPEASEISMCAKPDFAENVVTGAYGALSQVRWSPTADTLTASDDGGGLNSYRAEDGKAISRTTPGGVRIGGFDYFADGDSIASSSFDDDDVECGECDYIYILPLYTFGSSAYYPGLLLSPNGKQLVFGNIFVNSFSSWNYTPPPAVQFGNAFAFSPDGSVLLIGDSTHLATLSTSTMNVTDLSDPNHSAILGASFAPNGTEIAVIQDDHSVEVLNYPSCTEIYRLQGHTATVTGAMFSRDGRYLITSSDDSTMKVWDLTTGQPIYTYSYPAPLYTAGFSHDSKYVAASDGGTSVIVWDAPGNLKVEEQPLAPATILSQNMPNPVSSSTAFSYTAPYSEDVTIGLYDVMGREVRVLAEGRVDAGTHFVTLGAEMIATLPPGVYYYRIEAASGVATRRMVIE
ncbi:MAG TPA: T9SS type A sorting domain-containing protein [Candidatus Kapabacteria bacterium]|nr:T9SS type A sorting domain-containing protein [Candidatus Kapabacteria bacterium]